MKLVLADLVAEKIWSKDNRRICHEDVQVCWALFIASPHQETLFDGREEHDTWPPTEWILVKYHRQIMKLAFIVDDEEETAYLKTAFYVDQKTVKKYQELGGVIYG